MSSASEPMDIMKSYMSGQISVEVGGFVFIN